MGDKKMPAWPREPVSLLGLSIDDPSYERARYEAAMARLRAAVECMTDVQRILVDKDIAHREAVGMYNTLVAIGDLPPDPTEGG